MAEYKVVVERDSDEVPVYVHIEGPHGWLTVSVPELYHVLRGDEIDIDTFGEVRGMPPSKGPVDPPEFRPYYDAQGREHGEY